MNNRGCYLHRLGYTGCDGMLDAAHLCPKQRLKVIFAQRGMSAHDISSRIWNPVLSIPICRKHHTLFDQKVIRLTEDQYPPRFREWAAENGFEFRGPRDGWVGLAIPPETGSAA